MIKSPLFGNDSEENQYSFTTKIGDGSKEFFLNVSNDSKTNNVPTCSFALITGIKNQNVTGGCGPAGGFCNFNFVTNGDGESLDLTGGGPSITTPINKDGTQHEIKLEFRNNNRFHLE